MKKTILALALGTMATLSMAGPLGDMYVSGSLGQTNVVGLSAGSAGVNSIDTNGHTGKVALGLNLTPNYSLEVGYADLGKYNADVAGVGKSFSLDSYNFSLVGNFKPSVTVPKLSLNGQVGLASTGATGLMSKSNYWTTTYGLGVAYEVAPKLNIGLNWDRYSNVADIGYKLDTVSVGLKYSF